MSLSDEIQKIRNDFIDSEQISKEEQLKLVELYQRTKDKDVLEKIIASCWRILFKISLKYYIKYKFIHFSDLFHEGVVGLISSIERFDFKYDNSLVTFAYSCIRRHIDDFLHENYSIVTMNHKNNKFVGDLRLDSLEGGANEFMDKYHVSNDFHSETQDEHVIKKQLYNTIRESMDFVLNAQEKEIIDDIYISDLGHVQSGKKQKLSRSWISRKKRFAIEKIIRYMEIAT